MSRLLVAALLALPCFALAAEKSDTYTDPKEAGIDFKIQGEYAGKDANGDAWGAQVIALGDGKFDIVGYRGGLPGDGWKRGDETKPGSGKLEGEKAKFEGKGENWTAEANGEVLTVAHDGKQIAELKKVNRKSSTLGAQAPQGALVLFDGSSADKFENGKIAEADGEKVLAASNPASKQKLGDHSMHIEFRTPFMPKARGQGRGNSGVYLQGRYECQVLDSFGLSGENNECGGIYTVAKPIVNMCLPPLSWQTYDIDFTAAKYNDKGEKTAPARATIKHNGVVIHDNLELKPTPGFHAEGPGPDSLYLQDHGNPVVFRNIWVVEKK
jgi:hypothetical protein